MLNEFIEQRSSQPFHHWHRNTSCTEHLLWLADPYNPTYLDMTESCTDTSQLHFRGCPFTTFLLFIAFPFNSRLLLSLQFCLSTYLFLSLVQIACLVFVAVISNGFKRNNKVRVYLLDCTCKICERTPELQERYTIFLNSGKRYGDNYKPQADCFVHNDWLF